ncbi:MAG: hydrogenase maturation nickel metallochaperone HypA [Nevskia sp.]|nr:hydrogenase maturation nickel metallochaperone HypA [Nevskia sp.]
MHELGVVMAIIDTVVERCEGARVNRVVLQVGKLSAVQPDALRFCFDLATEGSLVEGASLDIVEVPGSGRCRTCATVLALDQPYAQCRCGGSDIEWLSGDELRIVEIEVQ